MRAHLTPGLKLGASVTGNPPDSLAHQAQGPRPSWGKYQPLAPQGQVD